MAEEMAERRINFSIFWLQAPGPMSTIRICGKIGSGDSSPSSSLAPMLPDKAVDRVSTFIAYMTPSYRLDVDVILNPEQ